MTMTKPLSWREQLSRTKTNTICRAGWCLLRSQVNDGSTVAAEAVAKRLYGKDHGLDLVLRAASSSADLSTPAWAGVVAHDVVRSDLIQKITALSAAASLMEVGVKVDLTNIGSISVPGRVFNPATAGAWVEEGQPIPVRATPILPRGKMAPRKLAVITTYTREMVMADSIEDFVTMAIREASAALLDQAVFSTTTGSLTQPDGILAGATTVAPSSATAVWAISADIGALVEALANAGAGLEPVIVAAPAQATVLKMWRQEENFDIFASLALPSGTVVAVERSSFVSGFDGLPRFSTADAVTVHMEDTAPKDIVGTTGAVATPVKSFFQVDVFGLKMILQASWVIRNPAHVAIVENVTW
jgi:hypothetical protein